MRFAGSNVSFEPTGLRSAAGSSGAAAAAGISDISESFSAARQNAPRYDELAASAMNNRSNEKRQAMISEANVTSAGLTAFGQTKGDLLQAEATIEAARMESEAARQKATMGAIGSIAGAAFGLFKSDETTKTNIEQIDSALEKLRNLKPVSFYYKKEYGDPSRKHHGFIAQEYKQVLPDATYQDEESGKLCIDPIDVIALLVRANQELEARITRLEVQSVLEAV